MRVGSLTGSASTTAGDTQPVTCRNGDYQIVQGLAINDFSRARMDATHKELLEERDGVKDLI